MWGTKKGMQKTPSDESKRKGGRMTLPSKSAIRSLVWMRAGQYSSLHE